MWKNKTTVILTGVLALALLAGSAYIVLRPETAHAQGRRLGNTNDTAMTGQQGCSCEQLTGSAWPGRSQGLGNRVGLQDSCEGACGGLQDGASQGVGIRRRAGVGQAR